jgi:hypothetical protein
MVLEKNLEFKRMIIYTTIIRQQLFFSVANILVGKKSFQFFTPLQASVSAG